LDSRPHYRENLAISSFGGDTTSKYQVDTVRIILRDCVVVARPVTGCVGTKLCEAGFKVVCEV